MTIKIKSPSGQGSPTVTISLGTALCTDEVENVFPVFMSATRDDTGIFEPWSGVLQIRSPPDLREAGSELARPPAAGGPIDAVSTSAADGAGLSGANQIIVSYIEAGTFYSRIALIQMSGLTPSGAIKGQISEGTFVPVQPITPVLDAIRVNRSRVGLVGVDNPIGAKNVGDISVRISTVEQLAIPATLLTADSLRFFIPRGFTACISSVLVGSLTSQAGFFLDFQAQVWTLKDGMVSASPTASFSRVMLPETALVVNFPIERPIPTMTDNFALIENPGPARGTSISLDYALFEDASDPDPNPELQPFRILAGR